LVLIKKKLTLKFYLFTDLLEAFKKANTELLIVTAEKFSFVKKDY